jgi:pimeloyl-ACP methyl ester carboxylesterase
LTPIFIHGAASNQSVWHLQLHQFKSGVAVELPGHPTGEPCSTVEEYANYVENYIRKRDAKHVVLVGHSMGGAIALTLALRNLDLAGLVLVGTGARLRVHPDILAKVKENYSEASKLVGQWAVSHSSDPVIAERIAEDMLKVRVEVALNDFVACNQFDRMDDVQNILCRTLIIVGADDRMTPVKYSQYLHNKIAGSKLVLIPGAGHSVMLEKHHMFNDALQDFLNSL